MNYINAKSNTYPFVEVVLYSEIVRRSICAVNQSRVLRIVADGGCGGGLDFAPMHAIHRYTRPNCSNLASNGVSHMSLALLIHWR